MANLKRLVSSCKRIVYERLADRRTSIKLSPPVVSLTFDDVPRTVITNGLPILDREDIRATFYVALGYKDQLSSVPVVPVHGDTTDFFTREDVRSLHRAGHDIECHTYSHFDMASGATDDLVQDCKKSRVELSKLIGDAPIEHFAYPRGAVTRAAKQALGRDYKTLRGVYAGINYGSADLTLLRANRIYSHRLDLGALARLLQENEKRSGWVILYTHGVQENPDPWSSSPDDLLKVIRLCKASGCRILTVSEAYEALRA